MLLSRHVLKTGKDSWAYSFWYSFMGAIVSLPFVLFSPTLPLTVSPWLLIMLVSILIVVNNVLVFRAMNSLEASIGGALSKFRLVWVFLFGILLLHEVFSWYKVAGTLFTILAGFVVVKKFQQPEKLSAVLLVIISTILNASIVILYKYLFASFNVTTMTFLIFLIPAIIHFIIMPNSLTRIKKLLQTDGKLVLVATTMGGFANLAINQSFLLGEVSRVTVLSESFLIVTLLFEHTFFREKQYLRVKSLSVILAVIGAVLMVIQ